MPIRLCLERACPNPATYRGRCSTHAQQRNVETHRNRHIYNSKRWALLRRHVLYQQSLCPCGAIATDVDHITPIEQGGNPWARGNLQGLCVSCHAKKTRREQAAMSYAEEGTGHHMTRVSSQRDLHNVSERDRSIKDAATNEHRTHRSIAEEHGLSRARVTQIVMNVRSIDMGHGPIDFRSLYRIDHRRSS